jgi:hypothetical protein
MPNAVVYYGIQIQFRIPQKMLENHTMWHGYIITT